MTAAEQLKRLAEVLPKEMEAEFMTPDMVRLYAGNERVWLMGDGTNIENAPATIALLDAIRREEERLSMDADTDEDRLRYEAAIAFLDQGIRTLSTETAVAAALAVFGGESESKEEG